MKCSAAAVAQRAEAGHRVAGKLRQRLAAEARSAGAENDDVGGAVAKPRRGVVDGREIVASSPASAAAAGVPSAWRARSQSSAAPARASASSKRGLGDAVRADRSARAFDRLVQ